MKSQVRTGLAGRGAGQIKAACVLLAAAVLFFFFPVFRIVSLDEVQQKAASAVFDAERFVEDFWRDSLMPGSKKAIGLGKLIKAHEENPDEASKSYGNKLGLSPRTYYLVSVAGNVESIDETLIAIQPDEPGLPKVLVEIGPVFGNVIRDASGDLNIGDFANTREFNEVSAAINAKIEEQVLPVFLEKSAAGRRVTLYGGIELQDRASIPQELYLTLIGAEWAN